MYEEIKNKVDRLLEEIQREYFRENYTGAQRYLRELISLGDREFKDRRTDIIKWKLRINLALDKFRDAERELKKLEKIAPREFETHLLGAHLFLSRSKFFPAEKYAHRALKLAENGEDKLNAAIALAEALLGQANQKMIKLAEKKKTLELSSLPPVVNSVLQRGVKLLQKVEDLAQSSGEYWEIIATYFQILNRGDEEFLALKRAVQIDPDNVDYLHNLALCYLQRGEPSKAVELFQKIYFLEISQPKVSEKLLFTEEQFKDSLQIAWSEVKFNFFDDQLPFPIQLVPALYPPKELIEKSFQMFGQFITRRQIKSDVPSPGVGRGAEKSEGTVSVGDTGELDSQSGEFTSDFSDLWSAPLDPRAPVFLEPVGVDSEPHFKLWVFQKNVEREFYSKRTLDLERELLYILTFALEELFTSDE